MFKKKSPAENLIRQHLERMDKELSRHPGYKDIPKITRQLRAKPHLKFLLAAIDKYLAPCLANNQIASSYELFPDWCLAITVCPALMPDVARLLMPGGYLNVLNEITAPAYTRPEQRHVAHWVYCDNGNASGIHLTMIPHPEAIKLQVSPVIAQDFLTMEERQIVGI